MKSKFPIILFLFFVLLSCASCENKNKHAKNSIIAAAYDKDITELNTALRSNSRNINLISSAGYSALHYAVNAHKFSVSEYYNIKNGTLKSHSVNPEILLQLLEFCADPNVKDYLGTTPIVYAVYHHDISSIYLLMIFGAKVAPAIQVAKTRKYVDLLPLLETKFPVFDCRKNKTINWDRNSQH